MFSSFQRQPMFFKSFRFRFQCYLLSKFDMKTQNYERAAMLMSQLNTVGNEFFSPVNTFCCSNREATWVIMLCSSIVLRETYQGKGNFPQINLILRLIHEYYRLRRMDQWRDVKRWNLFWNKWGCVWLRRITLEHRSSARRSVQNFLRTIKNRFVMYLLFHWALNTVWQTSLRNCELLKLFSGMWSSVSPS